MSFETISLLLNWMEMGALLAILSRLSSTCNRIANTQRELRRAIYHLGERRGAELGTDNAFDRPGIASVSRSRLAPANTESIMGSDCLASLRKRWRTCSARAKIARNRSDHFPARSQRLHHFGKPGEAEANENASVSIAIS